jgi:surface antigen
MPSPTRVSGELAVANCYSYGYGTYYVATRRNVPCGWGNANTWYIRAQATGYKVGDTPKMGAIAWTDAGPYGQVAIVEGVNADGTVVISEMDGVDGWNRVTTTVELASSFTYIY